MVERVTRRPYNATRASVVCYDIRVDLEPSELDALVNAAKRQLRSRMRALRAAIPPAARARRSSAVVARVLELDVWQRATGVGLYCPLLERGEVDVGPLDSAARDAGKRVFYPGVDPEGRPSFGEAALEHLEERGRGFAEPPAGAPEARMDDLDLLIVPALAVDEAGVRLGYGSGFYDDVLGRLSSSATSIVVAFQFQLLGEVPKTTRDRACRWVVTDERVFEVGVAPS
jgi:5-formyltetrahydrofolate cyclo-ligase